VDRRPPPHPLDYRVAPRPSESRALKLWTFALSVIGIVVFTAGMLMFLKSFGLDDRDAIEAHFGLGIVVMANGISLCLLAVTFRVIFRTPERAQ
jgi:Na+/melibiose symporter-like transporter